MFLERVPLTISFHLYFVRVSTNCSMFSHWSVGRIESKKIATFCLHNLFLTFFCFPWKGISFYHFHFVFWWSIKLLQQNINQSEARIGDKKLSVGPYILGKFKSILGLPGILGCLRVLIARTLLSAKRSLTGGVAQIRTKWHLIFWVLTCEVLTKRMISEIYGQSPVDMSKVFFTI